MASVLRLEVRETLRQRLTWFVLGFLLVAMLIGGAVGAARVRSDRATLDRVGAEARAWIASAKVASLRYGKPASYQVAQFRDPTDAYGYMFNFLTSAATRTPGPLAALTAGQSDLQPGFIRVNFADVFPDSAYELKSPRILALGAFDLGFVLIYLVPLALIALGGTRLASEQDNGILRMIAAQPVGARTVATAKFAALGIVAVPVVTLGTLVALVVTGGVDGASAASVLMLLVLVSLYALFWIAACALAVSFWKGAVGALTTLVLGWAAATVLLPAFAALMLEVALPAPSRLAYVDASRTVADRLAADPEAPARWLLSRGDLAAIDPAAGDATEVGRLATQQLTRQALLPRRRAFDEHAVRTETGSALLRLVSPALVLDDALQRLADTDAGRQRRFVEAADRYAQTLRRWFEPRILANIGKPPVCVTCPGRLNFDAYDAVPTFRTETPTVPLVGPAFAALYLAVATVVAALIARHRFVRWPL